MKVQAKEKYKAELVGISGSYIRFEQVKSSDLDILVRSLKGATLFSLVGLANFLEEQIGTRMEREWTRMDIVPIDTVRKEIKENILKETVYL